MLLNGRRSLARTHRPTQPRVRNAGKFRSRKSMQGPDFCRTRRAWGLPALPDRPIFPSRCRGATPASIARPGAGAGRPRLSSICPGRARSRHSLSDQAQLHRYVNEIEPPQVQCVRLTSGAATVGGGRALYPIGNNDSLAPTCGTTNPCNCIHFVLSFGPMAVGFGRTASGGADRCLAGWAWCPLGRRWIELL
jgi:hypothetical protein